MRQSDNLFRDLLQALDHVEKKAKPDAASIIREIADEGSLTTEKLA